MQLTCYISLLVFQPGDHVKKRDAGTLSNFLESLRRHFQ